MGLSLQEQLLKAGLVNKTKASKVRKEKNKKVRQQRNTKGSQPSEAEQQRQKERAEQAARDRELNQQQNDVRKQREIAAQVKQLIVKNRLPRSTDEDDTVFYFQNKNKVKQIYVSAEIHKKITRGQLAIVNYNGVFEIVPADIADKIRQRNPSLVIELSEKEKPDEDDPYADYQVPDDLQW